jgi:predicted RNA-binding Zn-ribbon protein involved in translation (DUF1610 family)
VVSGSGAAVRAVTERPEPIVKCQACGGGIPLSSGWGPVGDKRFQCPECGALSDLCVLTGRIELP